jgi:hypothetical protein
VGYKEEEESIRGWSGAWIPNKTPSFEGQIPIYASRWQVKAGFAQGTIHSSKDHMVWWLRPNRAAWIGNEQYAQIPQWMWVRDWRVGGRVSMTTLLDHCHASACEIDALHAMRWEIEMFFDLLKEGCRVEQLQLGGTGRLQTALALHTVIACRINTAIRQIAQLGRGF